MKILILTAQKHIYSNVVMNRLIHSSFLKRHQVMLLEETALIPGYRWAAALRRYLKISGFRYVFVQACKQYIFRFRQFIDRILKQYKSPYFPYTHSVQRNWSRQAIKALNSPDIVKMIQNYQPDMILSIFSRDIIPRSIFSIPKYGCVNLHPGLLPFYRGVSPTFWCLANRETHAGVTLHHVDAKIDQGAIVSHRSIKVTRQGTEHGLYLVCSWMGADLISKFVFAADIDKDTVLEKPITDTQGQYYSLPDKKSVARFRKNGHCFFKLWEFIHPARLIQQLRHDYSNKLRLPDFNR